MKPIRILVADDHAVVIEGLVALIGRQNDMEIVAQATTGEEAVEEWNRHRPDISLLDLRMPGLDAVGVINRIRETDPAARCLVLTTFDTDEDIYRAVKSGAKGYLLKDAPRDILLESIRKVHGGETCLAPKLTQKLGVSGVFTGTSATRRLPSGARPDQTNIQGFGTASARSNVPRSSVPLAKNWRAAPPATPFGGTGALPAFVIIAGDATRPLGLRKRAS